MVVPEDSTQADTIIVGPYQNYDRAERAIARIERLCNRKDDRVVACMIMDCVPDVAIATIPRKIAG